MNKATEFSHIKNNKPSMVDISKKALTERSARAQARIIMPTHLTERLVRDEPVSKKGPVFHTAIIAGTMAAKNTANLIPFAHPLALLDVRIDVLVIEEGVIEVDCRVKCFAGTGVEMEALTGATMACLTIYDMCKSITTEIVITDVKLREKSGGKHDFVCS